MGIILQDTFKPKGLLVLWEESNWHAEDTWLAQLELCAPNPNTVEECTHHAPPKNMFYATMHQPRTPAINALHNCTSTMQGFRPKSTQGLLKTFFEAH
eukprot:1156785-Pelagomonas_calceolata.AAC.13